MRPLAASCFFPPANPLARIIEVETDLGVEEVLDLPVDLYFKLLVLCGVSDD